MNQFTTHNLKSSKKNIDNIFHHSFHSMYGFNMVYNPIKYEI